MSKTFSTKNFLTRPLAQAIRRFHRGNQGHVFLVVLIILAFGSLTIVPLLSYIGTGVKAGQVFENKTADLYAADAGVEDAIWQITHNGEGILSSVELTVGTYPVSGLPPYLIETDNGKVQISEVTYSVAETNGRTVDVTLQWLGSSYYIVSNARDNEGNILTTVKSFISVTQSWNSDGGNITFNGALTSLGGGIVISGSSPIIGDVFSNGSLQLTGSASIHGNAYAENFIDMAWSTSISGDAATPGLILSPNPNPNIGNPQPGGQNLDPITLTQEQIDGAVSTVLGASDFTPIAAGSVTHSGNHTFQPWWPPPSDNFPGQVHVSGNLDINNATNITFYGAVHVDGDMKIYASGKTIVFEAPVVVGGKLTLQNGDIIFKDSVYVSDGEDLVMTGTSSAAFEGPVRVGGDLDLGSGSDVSFNSTVYAGGNFESSGSRIVYLGGDIYVAGNLTMKGSSKLVGGQTVIVMGNVNLVGSTKIENIEDFPFILIPSGNFAMSGSNYVSAWIYAPEAEVTLSGNVRLYGGAITLAAAVSGSSTIEFPPGEINPIFIPGVGGGNGNGSGGSINSIKVESWIVN